MLSQWLKNNLDASTFNQSSLARELTQRLGRSIDRAAVNKMTLGSRKISADELIAITEILGIGRPDDVPLRPNLVSSYDPDAGPRIPLTPHPQKGGRPDLAVRGIALGGKEGDGDFQLNGDALQYLERPAGLLNKPNAFAVILRNTSMEPVYKHGWPIFVDPDGRKPVDGEDVLIELHGESEHEPGPAFIKTLVGRRGGQVLLSQYNPPPDDLSFPADRVKQILRVIPYVEAMGLGV
jgi:hypothetical protein